MMVLFSAGGCEQNQTHQSDQSPAQSPGFQDGDIIFQVSLSSQSKAIQLATASKYSHCGIVYREGDVLQVYEAVGPVKLTPLEEWVKHGEGQKFVLKRLKSADHLLTPLAIQKMKSVGQRFLGKPYDLAFEWSDKKIYCSELVWKIYQEGIGVSVGSIEHLKDFDLTHPVVRQKLLERYGSKIPLEEEVVSPASIFDSEILETIFSN